MSKGWLELPALGLADQSKAENVYCSKETLLVYSRCKGKQRNVGILRKSPNWHQNLAEGSNYFLRQRLWCSSGKGALFPPEDLGSIPCGAVYITKFR